MFISGWPTGQQSPQIADLVTTLIISMIREKQDKELTTPPSQNIQLKTTDSKLLPMSIVKLQPGVAVTLPIIENSGKVLTYCKSGIHRSTAIAVCILIGQGYTMGEAMRLVKDNRTEAKPDTPHIDRKIEKFAAAWQEKAL